MAQPQVQESGAPAGSPAAAPTARRWWRRRRALVVVVLVLGLVWLLTPRAFSSYSSEPVYGFTEPVPDDLAVDLAAYPDRDVQVLWVRPRVTTGAADTHVSVLLCDGDGAGSGVGVTYGPLEPHCTDPRLPEGETVVRRDGNDGTQMVLTVARTPGGTVVVDGVDVVYRDGLRLGYQRVGSRLIAPFAD